MKIITIGDTHGKDLWREAVDKTLGGLFDKCVFIGDYTDSFDIPNNIIFENLKSIIKLKKIYPDKIVLLYGNHDIQYALVPGHVNNPYWCSGYRGDMHVDLYELFSKNKDLFQLAYQHKNYLWTHAGIHQGWWDYDYPYTKEDLSDIAKQLNLSFDRREPSIFQVGRIRGGFKNVGGPLWADKALTSQKPLEGLYQIVGHSRVDTITTIQKSENTSITFCHCLDRSNEFYKLEI